MSKMVIHGKLDERRNAILQKALGFNYQTFEYQHLGFDYQKLMSAVEYDVEQISEIQNVLGVGNTPIFELKNISALARKYAESGYGARIFLKDEAANASGSFKARRAALAVHQAKKLGYKGVVAATSGNYGAAVASQAAKQGLKCIIIQECFDSQGVGQPEIIEKARKCEAFGAEVIQLSVGPELFDVTLKILEETNFFLASLYSPYAIKGIETLGYEIVQDIRKIANKDPEMIIATSAGGGNLTGTARGAKLAGAKNTKIIGASINIKGLHMASDQDFNRKSCTTGHTGFAFPFMTLPDRVDVSRNAARMLRYIDDFYTITQGEVFYVTEMLAQLEGIERGPAGNTSLAVAFSLAQKMQKDAIIVVQESEYTGAGKHSQPQIAFAKKNNIKVAYGNPRDEIPGQSIIFPSSSKLISAHQESLPDMKQKYLRNVMLKYQKTNFTSGEIKYLCDEIAESKDIVVNWIKKLKEKLNLGVKSERN